MNTFDPSILVRFDKIHYLTSHFRTIPGFFFGENYAAVMT